MIRPHLTVFAAVACAFCFPLGYNAWLEHIEEARVKAQAERDTREYLMCIKSAGELGVATGAKRPERRTATWYSRGLRHPEAYTCAVRDKPKGTLLLLHNPETNAYAYAIVTDYGPQEGTGASIDVSYGVAKRLGFLGRGRAVLDVEEVIK